MGKPSNITNDKINLLGAIYLDKREKEKKSCCFIFYSLSHSNHHAAAHLNAYSEDSSAYEKWQYLADVYATLASARGELGDSILKLFKKAFNANKDFNARLNAYLLVNPIEFDDDVNQVSHARRFETQLDISRALKIIIADHFLAEKNIKNQFIFPGIHKPLINIKHTDQIKLTDIANSVNSPLDITSDIVNALGLIYLATYSENSFFTKIRLHSNHGTAKLLRDFESNQNSYSCWMQLANSYATLAGSHGGLSEAIFSLFHKAFKITVYTYREESNHSRYGSGGKHRVYFEPKEISIALKGIINQFYENLMRMEQSPAISLSHSIKHS